MPAEEPPSATSAASQPAAGGALVSAWPPGVHQHQGTVLSRQGALCWSRVPGVMPCAGLCQPAALPWLRVLCLPRLS